MLARGNSSASARLRRAKSTTSLKHHDVSSEVTHIDPVVGRRDALAAAARAFERAQTRALSPAKEDNGVFAGHNRTPCEVSAPIGEQVAALHKKQSIRFAEPIPAPRRLQSITKTELLGFHATRSTHELVAPDIQKKASSLHINDDTVTALPVFESPTAIPPSSRRVRKIKSLFIPQKAPSGLDAFGQDTSKDEQGAQVARKFPVAVEIQKLKVTGLYSDFKPEQTPLILPRRHSCEPDAAIQVARNEFLRQLETQRLREKPSIMAITRRRSHKTFPKTVRSDRLNQYGNGIGSDSSRPPSSKHSGLGSRARKFSDSLKLKLRRFIRREKTPEAQVPIQQLEAHRNHFDNHATEHSPKPFSVNTTPDIASGPHGSSMVSDDSHFNVPHRVASIETYASTRNFQRSRATTWTDSSARNTSVASTLPEPQILETQRLNSIGKYGTAHASSSTMRDVANPHGSFALNDQVLDDMADTGGSLKQKGGVYDLALRIQENQQNKLISEQRFASSSSGRSQDTTRINQKQGIRKVTSQPQVSRLPSHVRASITRPINLDRDTVNNVEYNTSMHTGLPQSLGKTPQQIAARNERLMDADTSTRDVRSLSSGHYIDIGDEAKATQPSYDDGEDEEAWKHHTTRLSRDSASPLHLLASGLRGFQPSESTYSRSTSGRSPEFGESASSLPYYHHSGLPGTATITVGMPTTTSRFQSSARVASVGEYGSEMSGVDESKPARLGSRGKYNHGNRRGGIAGTFGHRREMTEIDGEDMDAETSGQFDMPAFQRSRRNASTLKPVLRHRTSKQMNERYPVLSPQPSLSTLGATENNKPLARLSSASTQRKVSRSDRRNPSLAIRNQTFTEDPSESLYRMPKAMQSPNDSYDPHDSRPQSNDQPRKEQLTRILPGSLTNETQRLSDLLVRVPHIDRGRTVSRQNRMLSVSSLDGVVPNHDAANDSLRKSSSALSPGSGHDQPNRSHIEEYRGYTRLVPTMRHTVAPSIRHTIVPTVQDAHEVFSQDNSSSESFPMRPNAQSAIALPESSDRDQHLRERLSFDGKANSSHSQVYMRANDRNSPERKRRLQRSEQNDARKKSKENFQNTVRHNSPILVNCVLTWMTNSLAMIRGAYLSESFVRKRVRGTEKHSSE